MPDYLNWVATISVVVLVGCAASAPEPVEPSPSTASALTNADGNDESGELQEVEIQAISVAQNTGSPDEVICRREKVTGSHMRVRVCRTRAQIEAEQAEAQEFMRGFGVFDASSEASEGSAE